MLILEKISSYLFLFLLPLQVRLILGNIYFGNGPEFSEWTSAFLYGTDLLMFLFLILWAGRSYKTKLRWRLNIPDVILIGFLGFTVISALSSDYFWLSIYSTAKLLQFILFYLYLRSNLKQFLNKDIVAGLLLVSGVLQAIIGIIQYSLQSMLGLRFLWESPIIPGGEGVASFYIGNTVYLRAYGTLPHPNILATFLVISTMAFLYLYFRRFDYFANVFKKIFGDFSRRATYVIAVFIFGILIYGLGVTFSRTVIGLCAVNSLLYLGYLLFYHRVVFRSKKFILLCLSSIAVLGLFLSLNWSAVIARSSLNSEDEAVALRVFYNQVASETTSQHLLLGTGPGSFVPYLTDRLPYLGDYFLQPVHNIYLLISSEIGLLGLAFFVLFLVILLKGRLSRVLISNPESFALTLVGLLILAIGLFDHLLWTIQQGRAVLWLTLALLSTDGLEDSVQ